MKYLALLRGVNVGGKHPVPKKEFQHVLESLGFREVMIYINSGNAIFTSKSKPTSGELRSALETHFGFEIPTIVLPAKKVQEIASAIPEEWTNDSPNPKKSGQKSDVVYLFDEVNVPNVLEQLGHRPEVETMLYIDGAILTNITRKNQSKGTLQKLVGTELYKHVTIRNITTAKKLAELVA